VTKLRILILAGAAAAMLWGADFWETKPYTQWSEKEVAKILGDSPWSKTTTTTVDMNKVRELAAKSAPPEAEEQQPLGRGGGGGRGGRGGGGGGGGPAGRMAPMLELSVRWQSSLTVRQAMVRGQFGDEAATSEKAQEFLGRKQNFYVVMVSRLPMRYFQRANPQEFHKVLAETATLTVKGLEVMKPADIQFQASEQVLTIFFAFPREQTITLEHKEAEFAAPIGPMHVKRKFKLAEMLRDGKLDI
jgi:hypothetical protein